MAGNKGQIPSPTEIEVSVFGPGFGESIALHFGEGRWAIIDSCITPGEQQPAALRYLLELGVDVASAVKLVIVTHWHDDHIRGVGSILRACTNARFFCSAALRGKEVLQLVELYGRQLLLDTTGVSELTQVVDELKRRRGEDRASEFVSPDFAVANLPLWPRPGSQGDAAQIWALSPSSEAMAVAATQLSQLAQDASARRLPDLSPNHASVVLWVRVRDTEVLLGSDLEERGDQGLGWTSIVNSTNRPEVSATAFKTAHHGSENGNHVGIWEKLLRPKPATVTTPFIRGKVNLPTKEIAKLICARSGSAHITAHPVARRSPRRSAATERIIRSTVRWIQRVEPVQGHVRLRQDTASTSTPSWTQELFGEAVQLEHLAAS